MNRSTDRPNMRQLRVQAKELVRAVRATEPDAVARVVPYFHSSSEFTLANAQLVIARENGFDSWPKLRRELDPSAAQPKSPSASLFEALESGDDEGAAAIVRQNPEVAGVWRHGEYGWTTPLHIAAKLGRASAVRALVESGAEIYAVNQGDYPPVFEAVTSGHSEVGEYLLEASAQKDGGIPPTYGCGIDIVLAARLGMLDRVQMHVKRDPLAIYRRGCIGETVLHWPAHNGHTEVVRFLVDSGALIEADEIGLYGGKPLHWAAEHAPACVALLLERGADPVSRNLMPGEFEGFTPLHMTASQRNECIECAELLLAAGADPGLKDAAGRTPLDVAREHKHEKMAEFLT